jgi:hypothetical protein
VTPFSWSTLRQPVNAFNVTTALDAETRHTRICIETLDLLVNRHQGKDVVDPLFDWKIGILEGIPGLWVWHKYSNTGDQDYQRRNFRHLY